VIKLDINTFIERSKIIHDNIYNYDQVEYVNNNTPVKIKCEKHGIFLQKPYKHLIGQKCPFCAGKYKNNLDFINKANKTHNNRYDYSFVEYKNATSKVKIICKEHGVFEQLPNNHYKGHGCPKCNGGVKYDKDYFILKANEIHNFKYDYSDSVYINASKKIQIRCDKHGIFNQTPNSHLMGHGCPKCYNDSNKLNQVFFINQCNEIHDKKYDYSLLKYTGIEDKIEVICPTHGPFWQSAKTHLKGSGCKKCFENKMKLDINTFIERSKIIHDNIYNYDRVEYVNNYTPVKILCPVHGVFEQTPKNHMMGVGCYHCIDEKKLKLTKFIKYSRIINNYTKKNKNKLLENWDGFDFYDKCYIKTNFNLHPNNKNYPTIDHKISKLYGFLNNIDPLYISDISNLCFTKRSINSTKHSKNIDQFLKEKIS
jgi:uncharacterized C2H2 Zn-finger protein/protein-arginine kinase activator protein McsA